MNKGVIHCVIQLELEDIIIIEILCKNSIIHCDLQIWFPWIIKHTHVSDVNICIQYDVSNFELILCVLYFKVCCSFNITR